MKINGLQVELGGDTYSLGSPWAKEGLKELGLTPKTFGALTKKEQKEIVEALLEMGHLE